MRVANILWILALALVAVFATASRPNRADADIVRWNQPAETAVTDSAASEAPTPEATASEPATPDSAVPESAAPDSIYRIYQKNGQWIDVRRVEAWSMGMVRYRTLEGDVRFLDANKIASIEDAKGDDHWREVVIERHPLGMALPSERQSVGDVLSSIVHPSSLRNRPGYYTSEFGLSKRTGDGRTTGDGSVLWHAGFGYVRNLNAGWGVGGVLQIATDFDGYHFGAVGVRLHRYMGREWGMEGTTGMFIASDGESRSTHGIPLYVEAALNTPSIFSLFARAERHSYSLPRYLTYFPSVYLGDSERSETALHVGLRIAPRLGKAAIPGAVAGALLVLLADDSEKKVY